VKAKPREALFIGKRVDASVKFCCVWTTPALPGIPVASCQ